MADGWFSVDPDGLRRHVPGMEEVAASCAGLGAGLSNKLSQLGNCWGDDAIGEQFESSYGPARDELLGGFDDTAGVIKNTAEGITTMARGFAAVEEHNIAVASGLNGHGGDLPKVSSSGGGQHTGGSRKG